MLGTSGSSNQLNSSNHLGIQNNEGSPSLKHPAIIQTIDTEYHPN